MSRSSWSFPESVVQYSQIDSIGTNGTIGTNGKVPYFNGSKGEYASHKGDLDYFLMWSNWVQGNSNGPLVPMVRLVPIEKAPYSNGSIVEYASH